MGKNKGLDACNYQKYGVPFYVVAWVPSNAIKLRPDSQELNMDADQSNNHVSKDGDESSSDLKMSSAEYYAAFAGGGGEGRSGIPNAVLLVRFDFALNSLSEQPVAKCGTGSDLPYRMTIHPGGDGLICSLPKSCRLFEWDGENGHKLGLKLSEKVLSHLEEVGLQLALAFNSDGSLLATGGQDGNLRVFKWPSMEIILNETGAHTSVKDIDFSSDGKYLVSLGGPCRVWDVTSSKVVASLPKENDERFGSCRFSHSNDGDPVLYTTMVTGKGGCIVTWNTTTWKRISSRLIVRDAICATSVSADGKLLACGTTQGDIVILNSTSMRVQQTLRKAHLGLVTSLSFSHDSRALASASMDSSARITIIENAKEKGGLNLWVIIFIIIFAVAAYIIKNGGYLS